MPLTRRNPQCGGLSAYVKSRCVKKIRLWPFSLALKGAHCSLLSQVSALLPTELSMSVNDASLSYSQRLSVLHQKLDAFKADDEAQEEDSRREYVHFIGILRDACTIVRDAEASGASPDTLDDVITQVDSLIHSAVEFGYGDSELFDFIPSFAHSPQYPEVKDQTEACFRGLCEHDASPCFQLTSMLTSAPQAYGDFGGLLQLLNMFSSMCAQHPALRSFRRLNLVIELDSPQIGL
jgi:hypothetical protein